MSILSRISLRSSRFLATLSRTALLSAAAAPEFAHPALQPHRTTAVVSLIPGLAALFCALILANEARGQ